MKRNMIRFFSLMITSAVSGMALAHPHHPGAADISHHLIGTEHLAALVVLVLVAGCCLAFVRHR